MYTDGQEKAKVGRVQVDIKGKSYRLRFTYPEGERHEFSIARVSTEGWSTAIRAAQLINRDIDLGDFDNTYARYSPKHAKSFQIATAESKKEYNLKELWEAYKEQNKDRVANSTKVKKWKVFDRYLDKLDNSLTSLNKANDFIRLLSNEYASGTLRALFSGTLTPCINLAIRQKKISSNPYANVDLGKVSKIDIECFEPHEIKAIIQSFKDNKFVKSNSNYPHDYYAPMVEFLALTGCRPSECHALTWDDIKNKSNKMLISFSKVYVDGEIRLHTKNYVSRIFPCNSQLTKLINTIPRLNNKNNLVFPSVSKGYVNQDNFRDRYWVTVVDGLVESKVIDKYLKPYALRHSFITRLIREGVDIATVASLAGNSPRTIINDYLASRKDFDLPEL